METQLTGVGRFREGAQLDVAITKHNTIARVYAYMLLPMFAAAVVLDFFDGDIVDLIGDSALLVIVVALLVSRNMVLSLDRRLVVSRILTTAFVVIWGVFNLYTIYFTDGIARLPWTFLIVIMAILTLEMWIALALGIAFISAVAYFAINVDLSTIQPHIAAGLKSRFLISLSLTLVTSIIKVRSWSLGLVEAERRRREVESANRDLERAARRNETLLQEVHHRVKNNMQVVASLLSLEKARSDDPLASARFAASVERVRAIALVHETLLDSEDRGLVNIQEYIHDLAHMLLNAISHPECTVVFESKLPELYVSLTNAIPLGLVVNEFMTNSIKHAFPNRRNGTLTIGIQVDDSRAVITYSDDGVGTWSESEQANLSSLGVTLIHELTQQIGGSARSRIDHGTTWIIELPATLFAQTPSSVV